MIRIFSYETILTAYKKLYQMRNDVSRILWFSPTDINQIFKSIITGNFSNLGLKP